MSKLSTVLYWLLVVFVAYLITETIRKIFGGSLGFEEFITALVMAHLGYNVKSTASLHTKIANIQAQLSEHLGWHKGKANHL